MKNVVINIDWRSSIANRISPIYFHICYLNVKVKVEEEGEVEEGEMEEG